VIAINAATADMAWREAARQVRDHGTVQPGRDQPTRELLHVAFTLEDPRQRLVFARPFNPALAVAEVIWLLSGGNSSDFLISWNPGMRRYVDGAIDTRVLHGAYGHRLGSRPRLSGDVERALRVSTNTASPPIDQLRAAYETLCFDPDSRQVVLQIWDANRDLPNPGARSADVPCNLLGHLMIRSGRLEWLQVMRSNDLMWGTPINFVQFTCLQEIVAGWLGIDVGNYVHVSDSLHVYERHWAELDSLDLDQQQDAAVPANRADLRITGYNEWEEVWESVAGATVRLAKGVEPREAIAIADEADGLPPAYAEWIALLGAESLRRRGHGEAATELINRAGSYWAASWQMWFERKRGGANATCTY
jgi:thymidylate synthase